MSEFRAELPKYPHYYFIHMATKSRFPEPFFIVINRRTFETEYYFKCVGYWSNTFPKEGEVKYDLEDIKDIMIPWSQIAYIENSQYKPKR